MRAFALSITFILTIHLLHAQQLTGLVTRNKSDTVVAGASVYFGGSTKGTSTNNEGVFTLNTSNTHVPLVVSCIGYYSTIVNSYKPGEPITVSLKPKVNIMREVLIGSDGLSRQEKERIFKREFLGVSDYALSCAITNIDDIDLRYDQDTETLTAFCNDPIIVKNKKLGYIIQYYLDSFARNKGHVRFAGNYLFKEDLPTDTKELKKVKVNREDVYSGSRMQFVRALWRNTLTKNGFEIYDRGYKTQTTDSLLYIDPQASKFIKTDRSLRIAYKKDYSHLTYLTKKEPLSYIDKDGFYGMGLSWAGAMSIQRIGDLLPFEYVSPQDGK